ncbi:hypothetical protein PPERSA_06348 [Pseudocohnilembus persalinus]|uniref:Uncharacterized protein n=1 Tax=Pseudocohnilembus persalinus TaxID=266149 RepID=A0A0V0QIV0_PSEPJ|nr:hypothetical protein PPERSA_06348 [Pseudocohnilembus persalinus]|eukprot:KRX02153.1 hypothetical protein PPERSA_06348 [Pseudocohnilembus persalinus]
MKIPKILQYLFVAGFFILTNYLYFKNKAEKKYYKAKHHMIKTDPVFKKAKCLNGEDYQIRFKQGDPEKYLLLFQGGGWNGAKLQSSDGSVFAQSEEETVKEAFLRSQSMLGMVFELGAEGLQSKDEKKNPEFGQFSIVLLNYCDGFGHQGYLEEPITDGEGKQIWVRGHENVKSTIRYLQEKLGINESSEVIIGGFAQGGISALMWSDYIQQELKLTNKNPQNLKFSLVLDSSIYFEDLDTNKNLQNTFQNILKIANKEVDLPCKKCIQENQNENQYRCFYAENLLQYIEIPTFIVQSAYDTWYAKVVQDIDCIQSKFNIMRSSLSYCNKDQLQKLEQLRERTVQFVQNMLKKNKQWGAYIASCADHCLTLSNLNYNNNNLQVPMKSGYTPEFALKNWRKMKNIQDINIHIDKLSWPHNIPCSEIEQELEIEVLNQEKLEL